VQGGKGCNFVRLKRGGVCGGDEEGSTSKHGEKLVELVAQLVTHPNQYTGRYASHSSKGRLAWGTRHLSHKQGGGKREGQREEALMMKKSGAPKVESASRRIDARIEELDDWRGAMLGRLRR